MHLLKTIKLCIFFILLRDSVDCVDSDDNVFKKTRITFTSDYSVRVRSYTTEVTARNLRDAVPKNVSRWGRFSVTVNDSKNELIVLKEESITDIVDLRRVLLSHNVISEIEPGAFKNLPHLEFLNLHSNNLTEIKPGTFANLPVYILDLGYNSISVLHPGAFRHLPDLAQLVLTGNHLRTLPDGVLGEAFNLLELALTHNHISKIGSEAFKNLTHLKSLDLNYNELTVLDTGCFKNVPQLRWLNLRGNKLREIAAGLLNFSKIAELDLGVNNISVIAHDAFHISTLRVLNLDYNKLMAWDSRWLRSTPKLESLYAADNQIEELPDDAVSYCSSINFAKNRIKNISPHAFRKLKIINRLNLDYNQIENWDINFLNNITVHYINVLNNKLQCIDGDLEKAFGGAEQVKLLDGNPWRPDCVSKIYKFQKEHRNITMYS